MLLIEREFGKFTESVKSNVTVTPLVPPRPKYRGMDSLKKIVGRIERRLKALNLSASKASTLAGLSSSAIYNLQRGAKGKINTKGVNAGTIAKLALVLRTTPAWLISAEGPEVASSDHLDSSSVLEDVPPDGSRVRVVGYVGAGSEAHYYAIAQGDFEEVEAPAGSNSQTVAVEIKGRSFGPLLDSWLVFYDDVRSPIDDDMIGEVCVVGLADDRILIKQIRRERDGSFTLVSNSSDEPIRNAEIEWAAKVRDMRPRR